MGWKNIKEHYQIEHIVQVVQGNICIGSPYIHNLIVIDKEGAILKKHDFISKGGPLDEIITKMEADPQKLRNLINCPDSFSDCIPVYTYEGGDILEKHCDALGWPNVTHDGCLMYENTFSPDRGKVIAWAKRNAKAGIEMFQRRLDDLAKDCRDLSTELARCQTDLEKLQILDQSEPDSNQDIAKQ